MKHFRLFLYFLIVTIFVAVTGFIGYTAYLDKKGGGAADAPVATEILQEKNEIKRDFYINEPLYSSFLKALAADEVLQGTLFITSVLKKEQEAEGVKKLFDSFSYDIQGGKIKKNVTDKSLYFLNRHDASDTYLYTGKPSRTDSKGGVYNTSLFLNKAGTEYVVPTHESQNLENFTRIRAPKWSKSGDDFLYYAQVWTNENDQPSHEKINAWKISVGNEAGSSATTTYFADGFGAQWAAEDSYIVYFKEDGIYAKKYIRGADHKNEKEFRLVTQGLRFSPFYNLAVSPDTYHLAFTSPVGIEYGNSSVDIYKIDFNTKSAFPLKSTFMLRIPMPENTNAYWPNFSPGGRYLSFQTREFKNGKDEHNTILFYDFFEKKVIKEFDFNDFNFDWSFNTGWSAGINLDKIQI